VAIAFLAIARVTMIFGLSSQPRVAGDWYNHVTYGMTYLLGFVLAAPASRGSPWSACVWTSFVVAIPVGFSRHVRVNLRR